MDHINEKPEPNQSLFQLMLDAFMSQIEPLCLGAMILVFVGNSNLITAVFPLSCFLYAVVMPRRALWFWKFITWYLIAEIMLKMLV